MPNAMFEFFFYFFIILSLLGVYMMLLTCCSNRRSGNIDPINKSERSINNTPHNQMFLRRNAAHRRSRSPLWNFSSLWSDMTHSGSYNVVCENRRCIMDLEAGDEKTEARPINLETPINYSVISERVQQKMDDQLALQPNFEEIMHRITMD